MKKIFYVLALFGILISMSACTSKCEQHVYDDCADTVCNVCGEKRDSMHSWKDADCTSPKICLNCQKIEGEPLCHSLEHYEMVDSTCTEDGIQEYWYCNVCENYFTDEEGSQIINEEDLVIKKAHIDENNDYLCDYDCGNVLITKEKLQKIIIDTLSSTKVTVNDFYTPSLTRNSYYFDENLLYIINDEEQEKYYYTENEITYLLTKTDEWKKEVTSEDISYTLSYLFEETYDLEIAENIGSWTCENGSFIDEKLIRYRNSLGTDVALKINEDGTLLDAILFFDEGGNFIHEFVITYGENKEIIETLKDINNYLDGNKYDETTNKYLVDSSQGMLDAIDNAEIISTTENPATIKLMKDIEVEAFESEHGIVEYAILIGAGNIIIDLNGYTLSATNDPQVIIQIGAEWGELCDAVLIINDSSINKTGKILASTLGIKNNGGKLIINDGTIEVNNTKEFYSSNGVEFYLGSVTINGGTINVTGICEYSVSFGIREAGTGGTFTMNGGYINVNAPLVEALSLRGTAYINGGTIESNMLHIHGIASEAKIYLGTNEEGIGATFVGGIKSYLTLNSLLTESVGYYDDNGNLIEVSDDVKEILDKGDITIKKIN